MWQVIVIGGNDPCPSRANLGATRPAGAYIEHSAAIRAFVGRLGRARDNDGQHGAVELIAVLRGHMRFTSVRFPTIVI